MNQAVNHLDLSSAREKLASGLDELVQLRPLPAIALQIMKACKDQKAKVTALVKLVECDAAISSRILSVVNSSLYGYSRDVTSINQAVVVLGFKNLSQLAVSIASQKVFNEGESAAQPRLQLYEHSLGCAAIARLLVNQNHFDVDPGAAFLAGLLHDVGKLVFFDLAPDHYARLQSSQIPRCDIQLEQQLFGINHSTVGARFGDIWGLPPEINTAIANHHETIDQTSQPILHVTCLANELFHAWELSSNTDIQLSELTTNWLDKIGADNAADLRHQANDQFAELKSLLSN